MLKFKQKNIIELNDWNQLVEDTYKRPYNLQQQSGCYDRGLVGITIPTKTDDDFENETVPEVTNGDEMGVSFKAWLARDPNKWDGEKTCLGKKFSIRLFWERNFYPDLQTVANDLHKKGLIPAGKYYIDIDW